MKRQFLPLPVLLLNLLLAPASFAKPEKVTDVFVVIKSHFDLGFTNQAENVFQRYRVEMMDKALGVIDQNRAQPRDKRFVWTVPGWPLAAQMLGPRQDADRRTRIEQAVKDGFLTVHALAGTTHTEALDAENLVRSLGFSSAISRNYGQPLPIAAKMTDVPSHSWIMPTLLKHAGIRFLHLGCNSASQYPRVPPLFWWEGADSSRVLCGYTIDYGSSLTPPADWPSANYLAMIMAGDNAGPPGPAEVEQWRAQLAQAMPGVKVHFGTLDDFAAAVLTEMPDLPVVRGDMPDTWIHGLLANPDATKTARNTQALEPALDALDTHLRLWGLSTPPLADRLAQAYELSFLYGEHTWGMNAEYGPRTLYGQAWKDWLAAMENEPIPADGDYTQLPRGSKRKWLQSYQDHRDYANTAATIVNAGLRSRLELLAANVKAAPGEVIVYNPLPWLRSGIVELQGRQYFAEKVPPCGYLTLPARSGQAAATLDTLDTQATLDTPFFTGTFDLTRGGLSSLIEKTTGRELADKASPYALGQFLHERFSTNEVFPRFFNPYSRVQDGWGLNDIGKPGMADATQVPYLTTTPGAWKPSISHTDAADCVTLQSADPKGLAKGYTMTFTFPRHDPSVEIEWRVEDKTADKHPEGGWLCFPFAVEKPRFTVGRLGAPIDPASDIVPGTNRHLMAVASGVALTRADASGVALCPLDSPLVSLDKPGLWHWTMDFVPAKPAVFVNLYNNMWNTNFPLWQAGSWSERVRFWPTLKETSAVADLTTKSWEARVPLLAVAAAGGTQLPATQAGLSVSRKGVLVTAFGANPDGEGTVLRVWEQAGVSNELTVTLPGSLTRATPVNLRGEPLADALPIKNCILTFPLNAYAPASFILR